MHRRCCDNLGRNRVNKNHRQYQSPSNPSKICMFSDNSLGYADSNGVMKYLITAQMFCIHRLYVWMLDFTQHITFIKCWQLRSISCLILKYDIDKYLEAKFSVGICKHSCMGLLPDTQNCRLRMRRECRERFPPPPTSKENASWRSRHASRHVRHARAVMRVGIAYPLRRGKRSRHSRRMRTRNFTYLARGPWHNVNSNHHRNFNMAY